MRKAWADLSAIEEVRDAARGWKAAGGIDAPALSAIEAAYPDPRIRLHGFWRVLIFVLVSAVVNALFFAMQPGSSAIFGASLIFGGLLVGATEALRGSRYSGTGLDAASSFWALTYLLVAAADLLFRQKALPDETAVTAMIAAIAVAGALAAWRWGFWIYMACAVAAAYVWGARFPGARPLWIAISIFGLWLAWRRRDAGELPPDHRRGLAAMFAVCAASLYVAVNLYSVDHRIVEAMAANGPGLDSLVTVQQHAAGWLVRLLAGLATAALPAILLAWGIRARRTLLLALGLAAAALSAVTLRYYVHVAPLWVILSACGAILIGVALAIQRALRERPGGEWRGLTAAPLYERERGISPLAALAAHAVGGTHVSTPEEQGRLETGGGEYGGGGATGSY